MRKNENQGPGRRGGSVEERPQGNMKVKKTHKVTDKNGES